MPSKKIIYKCKYCNEEFDDFDECSVHEKSHLRNFKDADTQDIIDQLRKIGQLAYGYHIGYEVMGMPVSNFESLMNEAVERLEALKKQIFSEGVSRDARNTF